ncbi:MAG: ABC transporter substrate-binding protein [Trueperaceae bacterium]
MMKRFTYRWLAVLAVLCCSYALAQDYKESPYLADKGLPPVVERLPVNPKVIAPFEGKTNYGGVLRFGFLGKGPGWGGIGYLAGWEYLGFWTPDMSMSEVEPNVAESWEISDDGRSYTFKLREGMKWSDGAPFTADDIMFYIEDIVFNEELNGGSVRADWLPTTTGDQLQVEKLDDYTVKFTFVEPNSTFLYTVSTYSGRQLIFYPKHYLSQFHPKYNENVDELVAASGKATWTELFAEKASGPTEDNMNWLNFPAAERPTINPWIVKTPLGTGTQIVLERNPYYWKVDDQGNQLPYIDEVIGISYEDAEARTLDMLNGELDFVKDPGPANRPLYFEAVDLGSPIYVRTFQSDGGNTNSIHFNRNTKDAAKAEVFANKDFRIGMSHAINRPEIIEIVHNGQGTPAQPSPLEGSPLYNEQLTTQYTEYNVDLANEALDKVLPEKDAEGFRLGPDGNRFSFALTVPGEQSYATFYVQVAELLKEYWAAVGIDMQINNVPNDKFREVLETNDIEATLFTDGSQAGVLSVLEPTNLIPAQFHSHFGQGWYAWRLEDPEREQVPMPDDILAIRNQYDTTVVQAASVEEQIEAMKAIVQIAADNFFVLGISRFGELYNAYSARVGNIPETWFDGFLEGAVKITFPEQWVIQE